MSTVARVVTNIRGIQTAIKDVGRLREIIAVLVRHGFGALVTRLHLTETVGVRGLMEYRDENEQTYSLARRIRMAIEELGPTFVKLGQILSTRSDIVPPDICEELQLLQDRVPPMTWEEVRGQIERELGRPVEEIWGTIDHAPLASASIAQVHRATLVSGEDVVVKVQRPGIAPRIESDLNILHVLARRAAAAIPEIALMDPEGIVHEFEKAILLEIDFAHEQTHIERFHRNFGEFEGIRIPAVYRVLSTSHVMTMEFIRGVKITRAPEVLGIDPYLVAPRMLRALFKMVFQDGYFHGDLHPGNILIQEDGTIGLIDFGLVGRLTPIQRDRILDVLIGMSQEDYGLIARVFFDIGVKVQGVAYDYDAFEADVIELLDRHVIGKTLNEIDVSQFFGELVTGAIRHRIRMPPTYTMVFKALMTVEGIGKQLAPQINFIEEAQPFVKEILAERYGPKRLMREGGELIRSLSTVVRAFPPTANQLMKQATRGELTFRLENDALKDLRDEHRAASMRVGRAIAFAGCVLAAVQIIDRPGTTVLGTNWMSFVLFCGGIAFITPLVIANVRGR